MELATWLLWWLAVESSPLVNWFFFFLPFSAYWCLAGRAPSISASCLLILLCSCACKAFKSSTSVISNKSLGFSKVVMDASNLVGTATRIFSTILEYGKEDPSNLTRFAMLSNLLEYSDGFSLLHLLQLKVPNKI